MKAIFLTSVAFLLASYFLPASWFSTETIFLSFKGVSCFVALILSLVLNGKRTSFEMKFENLNGEFTWNRIGFVLSLLVVAVSGLLWGLGSNVGPLGFFFGAYIAYTVSMFFFVLGLLS